VDFIKGWALTISGFIIIATIAEMLLPNQSIKKYAKLVLGLMLIVLVMKPILGVSSLNIASQDFASATENVVATPQADMVKATFAQKLASDMEAALKPNYGEVNINVEVGVDENNQFFIQGVTVSGAKNADRKEISDELSKDYGCDQVNFN